MLFLASIADPDLWGSDASPYSQSDQSAAQRLGRPASSKGQFFQASTWFDQVAAPRMQQMHRVQRAAVQEHDEELEWTVQQLTESLCQVNLYVYIFINIQSCHVFNVTVTMPCRYNIGLAPTVITTLAYKCWFKCFCPTLPTNSWKANALLHGLTCLTAGHAVSANHRH